MKVKRIEAPDTHAIRNEVLRPSGQIEDCVFEGDEDNNTFHLGAFVEGKLVSIASFYLISHPSIEDENQYQLRGMATLYDFRHKGLSSELLKVAFPIIKQNFCTVLWCHARENAIGFYTKVGFEQTGERFFIPQIGPHYLMVKNF